MNTPLGSRLLARGLAYVGVWLLVAAATTLVIFLNSSATTVLASHDAVLRPTLDRNVTVHLGPFLPDLRSPSGHRIGVDVTLGTTEAESSTELAQRYAFIASQPEGQVTKVEDALTSLALGAALRGAALGLLPVAAWVLVGAERRRDLLVRARGLRGVAVAVALAVVGAALWQPWHDQEETLEADADWRPLSVVVPDVDLPTEVAAIEVRSDLTTSGTQRLILSAIDTYERSKTFYAGALSAAGGLGAEIRQPEEGETVAILVSDRHDNIGMDAVARAIADEAGATVVLDAGDDTSTGKSWEAFSLDSLDAAFSDYDLRYAVAGNHDNGDFVSNYLADRGWTTLDGELVDGPGGSRLLGVDDARSSGLGTWRDETGLSFEKQRQLIADDACAADELGERVNTLLVHDPASGKEALSRGCVDLVVGGHLHTRVGPTRVRGLNGRVGYSFTTGTTGGAAYALAVGSKLRRPAEVALITYRDGRPAVVQSVSLGTDGRFEVSDFIDLKLG